MKVVLPKTNQGLQKKSFLILSLQEDVDETYALDKSNSVSWELSTRPGTAGAATYKFQGRILTGDETPRQMMRWRQDVMKLCTGLHVTTLDTRKPIMLALMRAGPVAVFEGALTALAKVDYLTELNKALQDDQAAGDTTASDGVKANGIDHYRDNDHLDVGLQMVVTNYLPRKVLARVKRAMRRDMRKPMDMKVRHYYQNLIRMNDEELPNLPPYEQANKLSEDELLDIILFGTPRSWQNEMERQGFDPIEKGIHQTVDFMEGIESVEPMTEVTKAKPKSTPNKKKKADHDGKPPYYCEQHGANWTHDTKDCRFLKNKKSGGGFQNKTWNRKASEASAQSKKELAALIGKTINKAVKKQLASIDKKRKSDDDDVECNLAEVLDGHLDGFNYETMNSSAHDASEAADGMLRLNLDDTDSDDEVSC